MAIDYYGRFACKVRESVSDDDLLRMEKAKNRAEAIVEMMRTDPKHRETPESEWTFGVVVMGPEGPEQRQVRIADALEEAAPLAQLSVHCEGCPFKANPWVFGCGGVIHYPISAKTEAWLMARLPDDITSHAGTLLRYTIQESHFDGTDFEAHRQRRDLLQSPRTLERKWGNFFSKKIVIRSDQVLEMMFSVGHLSSPHANSVAHMLGFVDDDGRPILGSAEQPSSQDDAGVVDMKRFLRVMALAGAQGADVYIDT